MNKVEKLKRYYKRRAEINRVILKHLKKRKGIVYGARALNEHFPPYLDRHTEDYDIYAKHPRKNARQLEKRLDKRFEGDYFYVESAKHPGTYKVKSYVTNKTVADFTKTKDKVPYVKKRGIKVVTIPYMKERIQETLKNKEAKFRWDKDREALNRIIVYENIKKKPRKTKKIKPLIKIPITIPRIPKIKRVGRIKW